MPVIKIPAPLRLYTDGLSEIAVQGQTVAGAMENFMVAYPALKPHLFNSEGRLRPFVNLFLSGENVNNLQGMDTLLEEDDRGRDGHEQQFEGVFEMAFHDSDN